MPISWDPELHARAQAEKAARPKTHLDGIVPDHNMARVTMRNWVIKTLCGFDVQLLNKCIEAYPTLKDDFTKLSDQVHELTKKAREANHKYTKK